MKNVIIFGGSGFLGSYIVKELAAAGHVITIFARDIEKANTLKICGNLGQIITVADDILSLHNSPESTSGLDKYVKGQDIVINLIGILTNNKKHGRNYTLEDINYKAAALIAHSAKNNNVEKLIHFSALLPHETETDYAQSKAEGEQAVKEIFPQAFIIKPGLVFGEEDKFFNLFARVAKIFRFLPLIAGGKALIQPVYVGDIAKFIRVLIEDDPKINCNIGLSSPARSLKQAEIKGSLKPIATINNFPRTYNLVGLKIYSLKELMIIIRDILKIRCFLIRIPYKLALVAAWFLEFRFLKPLNKLISSSTEPLLTREQVKLLNSNNISNKNATATEFNALIEFGIKPKTVEEILPKYLGILK